MFFFKFSKAFIRTTTTWDLTRFHGELQDKYNISCNSEMNLYSSGNHQQNYEHYLSGFPIELQTSSFVSQVMSTYFFSELESRDSRDSIEDDDLTEAERSGLCKKLLSLESLGSNSENKDVDITWETKLEDFVTPESWDLFSCLGFPRDTLRWLHLPANEWALDPAYVHFEKVLKTIVCTNVVAERAIKLVQVNS